MASPSPLSAYVDSSVLVAIGLDEPSAPAVVSRLAAFPRLLSSNLLEAEVRSVFARENLEFDAGLLSDIEWIHPSRSLAGEIATALRSGYLRGADLWHIAVALYLEETLAGKVAFVTLDSRQGAVAARLGLGS